MKNVIVAVLICALAISLQAQEKGKVRVGFDLGLGLPNAGAGIDGAMDVRYNIMDNVNVGLKFNGAVLVKDLNIDEVANTASMTMSVIGSTLVTSDYYFNDGTQSFAPFLGGGLGSYKIMNVGLTASGTTAPAGPTNTNNFVTESRFGGLIRGGFEAGHFRMALEYYLVPKSNLVDLNNYIIGTSANSYLNVTIGFYFGGGRWRKNKI